MVTHVAKDKHSSVRHQLAMMKNKEPNLVVSSDLQLPVRLHNPSIALEDKTAKTVHDLDSSSDNESLFPKSINDTVPNDNTNVGNDKRFGNDKHFLDGPPVHKVSKLSDSIGSSDTRFMDLMHKNKKDFFENFDDLKAFIRIFEEHAGLKLFVKRSQKGKFRIYGCKSHKDCPFVLKFNKRKKDGLLVLQQSNLCHRILRFESMDDNKADGVKKRGVPDELIGKSIHTWKKNKAEDNDNVSDSESHPNQSFVADVCTSEQSVMIRQSFQLIIPYLKEMKLANPSMFVEYKRAEDTKAFKRMFVSPGFANTAIRHVRPVIYIQTEKMVNPWGGTMYIATCLSAEDETFLLALSMSEGRANSISWRWFLETCLLYTSPSPRDLSTSRMPSSA